MKINTCVLDLMKAHRSIRKFTDEPVDERTLREIIDAARCASTSHFIQSYVAIHVTDPAVRHRIATLAGPQPWVEKAPVFLVFCADYTRLESCCDLHGEKIEKGWAEQYLAGTVDVALFAQNVLLAAESLGFGGVFIGGIRNDPETVCSLLAIPGDAYPVFGMCLGRPAHDPSVKPRLPLEAVFRKDRFDAPEQASHLKAYDETTRRYFLNRDSNRKDETWTGQMAGFMKKVVRPHMKAFLQERGFFRK